MKAFSSNLLCIVIVVYSSVISLIVEGESSSGQGGGRIRRENRVRKASLVRRLMRNSRRIREGSVRLMDGSTEHEGKKYNVSMNLAKVLSCSYLPH
jgi:hypothetical protein